MAEHLAALSGAPHSRTLAPAFVRAHARPDPCIANGPCTDRARARTNRAPQPRPATADDDTQVQAHSMRTYGPRTRTIPTHTPYSSRPTATHSHCDARSSLCRTSAPTTQPLAAFGALQQLQQHLLHPFRLDHDGGRRRHQPRRHGQVCNTRARPQPAAAPASHCHALSRTASQAVTHDRTNFCERHVPNCHVSLPFPAIPETHKISTQ